MTTQKRVKNGDKLKRILKNDDKTSLLNDEKEIRVAIKNQITKELLLVMLRQYMSSIGQNPSVYVEELNGKDGSDMCCNNKTER